MNNEILEKYNIHFYKNVRGEERTDGRSVLSTYVGSWETKGDIDDLLTDVDRCLNGQYDSVEDIYYDHSLIGIYAEITPDYLILSDEHRLNPIKIPMVDFREILLSWREFFLSS
ncbi:hypothetical protein D0C36_21520 [Mucilaginibacter conchicola]|uniref:Uncharacterized protein n=1 Tax=Mucilaginibacter conchicola TaxID=2303333 RepID=A0A372NN78_9SPHI|nr:hypothetical protein [Mucilaginibacter conchicola]RFZ90374.1 hypothetical protein D0C36_21520 [Mucilaginibacter conchicola]